METGVTVVLLSSNPEPAKELQEQLQQSFGISAVIRHPSVPSSRWIYERALLVQLDNAALGAQNSLHPSIQTTDALVIAKVLSLVDSSLVPKVQTTMQQRQQLSFILDAQYKTESYQSIISKSYNENLQITGGRVQVPHTERLTGKVRDRFVTSSTLALLTTDRQSGFDRQLAVVPYKGAVLNLCSQFWFEQTRDIIPNHLVEIPHPNVAIVKKCTPFPIEFVVRSYMTGSTSTSIWKNYQNGVRNYCGHALPEGMTKNEKLPKNLLTPTTKEEEHDRPISVADIVKENWMTQQDLDVCAQAALKVFARGQEIAEQHGLILVDTKYEFGKTESGEILLIDEVHTPDSSRYWLANSYKERIAQGMEPENIDKEFLRLWFRDHCDPYKDATIPDAPRDLVLELSRRYIQLYEMITWKDFDFEAVTGEDAISAAIDKSLGV